METLEGRDWTHKGKCQVCTLDLVWVLVVHCCPDVEVMEPGKRKTFLGIFES